MANRAGSVLRNNPLKLDNYNQGRHQGVYLGGGGGGGDFRHIAPALKKSLSGGGGGGGGVSP